MFLDPSLRWDDSTVYQEGFEIQVKQQYYSFYEGRAV